MNHDAIKYLKSSLADLTYILFVMGNEYELMMKNTDDEKVKNELQRITSTLRDSNNNVIKLYHEIQSNEEKIQNEWYSDVNKIKSLQHEVDELNKSINVLLEGNRNFLNSNS